MKRSNRLILLIGVFLAVIAFVGIAISLQPKGGPGPEQVTTTKVVVASRDLALGTRITADAVTTLDVDIANKLPGTFGDPSQVLGQKVRQPVVANQQITEDVLNSGGSIQDIEVPPGFVGISVQVDQETGVGTLIKPGDTVDMVLSLTSDKFPVVSLNPDDNSITVVTGINSTSVKAILQGMQVLGTLLPTPETQPADNNGQGGGNQGTALNGQQEIVVLAVTTQQAEVIKYAQIDGSISLVLRSSQDFTDEAGNPLPPGTGPTIPTTGLTLKGLVDDYGVLVPEIVETILPAQAQAR